MTANDLEGTTKDIADRAGKSARQAGDAAKGAVDDLTAGAQGLAGRAGDTASNLYERAREKVGDVADGLPGSADDAIAAGRRAYNRGSDQLSRQVAKQPIEALLLAGAIGFLVGWATNRS